MNNIIITVIVAILAMAIGCAIALYLSKKNAKSQANEIIEKARLEAEVLKNNEVLKGKEKGMSIKNEAEKEANARLSKVQTSEAKLKQREMTLNQQMGDLKRRNNELDGLKLNLDNRRRSGQTGCCCAIYLIPAILAAVLLCRLW